MSKVVETIKSELEKLPETSDKVVQSCPPSDPPSPPPDSLDLKSPRGQLLYLERLARALFQEPIDDNRAKTCAYLVQIAVSITQGRDLREDEDYPPEEQERRVRERKEREKTRKAKEQKWKREHPGQEPDPLALLDWS